MDAPLLRCEGVRRAAAGLRGIDLDLVRGEVLAVLAPGGAGKTALLRLVAGLDRPDAGRLLLAGRDLAPLSPPRRGLSLLDPLLPERRSVQEVAGAMLPAYDVPARDRPARIARALTALGLDGQEGKPVAQLGPAARCRLAFARALAPEQPVLLLDDPLVGLDPAPRRALGFELRRLFRRLDLSVLLATREGEEAMALADRVAVIEDGEIAQCAPPRLLYEEPATAFVAGLLGENNRLPGTVEWREETECAVRLDCGPVVEARVADAGGPGSRCIVAVRPERVAVAALPAEEMGEGALPAALRDTVFLGDHVRLLLELGEGGMLVSRRPPGSRNPVPGGPASVAWDPYAAFAYRALR
ncbi:ABC transporter ATP-binding protein [Belnapia sp. T6]|uniref:ABC transporter ATP-binding protein n=1 Tax=Belnapia mucosa TaxID=2804532 RepID=A0ABS1V5Q5_9PROT|nr:ABC transporter ATP-binding protein [Belnapia mucosa]MBL6455633.1 ABC transporter ATP-binding protein [Belnapia mucosa]